MRRSFYIGLIMLAALLFAKTVGIEIQRDTDEAQADWVTGINSSDYGASGTGGIVYNDLLAIMNQVNGGLRDTNFAADADIDGSKMADSTIPLDKFVYGLPYFPTADNDSSRAMGYGQAKIVDADSAIFPDAKAVVAIVWDDSTDSGAPGFTAVPRFINISYVVAADTICWQNETRYLGDHPAAPSFAIRGADASGCSVDVYNPAAGDTLWTWKASLYWWAIE